MLDIAPLTGIARASDVLTSGAMTASRILALGVDSTGKKGVRQMEPMRLITWEHLESLALDLNRDS